MMASYPEHLSKWKEEDFFSDKYNAQKAVIDEMIASKNASTDEINTALYKILYEDATDKPENSYVRISDIFSPAMLAPESEIRNDLYRCLELNNLTHGWQPIHKIKLLHSTADDIVPFINAEHTRDSEDLGAHVDLKESLPVGHLVSSGLYLVNIFFEGWMEK